MKRGNDVTLKQAVNELLDSYHLKGKLNEIRLQENWEKIFGKTIAKFTDKIVVKDKKLFLNISSSSLRQELTFSKPQMIARISEVIAPGFIEEIIIR